MTAFTGAPTIPAPLGVTGWAAEDLLEKLGAGTPDELPASVVSAIRTLLTYWNDKRGTRAMPSRADFDPMDVPRLLPRLLLIDVEGVRSDGAGIFRYRVVGGTEVANRGHNPTGRLVEEGFYAESLENALAHYEAVRQSKCPIYDRVTFLDDRSRPVHEDTILLPFSEDGTTVSQILVYSQQLPLDGAFKPSGTRR
ncbi:PAS domain-containing protein [Thalassobaculum sp. OXR-137]|uniref:PAS domain-containing protein n=1 Tax=Thalassobaculum sp. OXR-137 TaxID=3100173 RepID=UPI002AC96B13|nr:PAS domain-containing protein [Thalassobaculum sp. OXR-137]WPZ34857.1 PAS domain-containing protein [Thalassobaculum sp. OXR-137]